MKLIKKCFVLTIRIVRRDLGSQAASQHQHLAASRAKLIKFTGRSFIFLLSLGSLRSLTFSTHLKIHQRS